MRFARLVFLIAGVSGVLIIGPLYLEARFFADNPPQINRAEFYYGFAGVTLAWQLMFLVIAADPVRYRMAMLPAMVEKLSFAGVIPFLYASGRVSGMWLWAAAMDGTWLVLFVIAYLLTPLAESAPPRGLGSIVDPENWTGP